MTWICHEKRINLCLLPARCIPLLFTCAYVFSVLFAAGVGSPELAASAESAKNSASELRILTAAREAHSLSNEQARRGYPVHLRGVITFFDPDYKTGSAAIFIHDATGSIFLDQTSALTEQLFAGAFVDVRGVSGPGGFGPIVNHPQIRLIGRAPLPPNPPRVSLAVLNTGAYDAQWIEVEGSVHRVVEFAHSVTLRLELLDGPISVTMLRSPGATYSNLVDAQVRIHANAAPTMNPEGQMIGAHLQAPDLSTLQVVQPAASDPFALPNIPISGLLQWGNLSSSMHRVRLRGNVTLQWPGSLLCIRDATRGICAQTTQADHVAVGDLADVAGFVETENNAPVITDAVYRIAGKDGPIAPQPATTDKILRGGFSSELIQIDGQLIDVNLASTDATLLLSSGGTLVSATLPRAQLGTDGSQWKIGSKLRVTGICLVDIDALSHVREGVAVTKSFRVLLRTPADVTILQHPSWWTPVHAIVMLALALTATLVVLGWVAVLRRRVEQQADLLRESEQRFRHMALHDALTGVATRLLLQDRLRMALESTRRRRTGLAVLMVDLDRFKETNDTYGHSAGDEVLRVTANRLLQVVRMEDTVARVGGDEFVVLLQDLTDLEAAERIAATIVESLAVPIPFGGREITVTASVGVCARSWEGFDADDLLKDADTALYIAKSSGRNGFRIYRPNHALVPTA